MMTWLTALVTWPLPTGPTCVTVVPSTSSTLRTRSRTASSPPTMIESVPFAAPSLPPETGASSMATPWSSSAAAISRVVAGLMVLMSTSTEPSSMPSTAPSSPSTTAC
ncbi:MAG: hypothetical protein P8Y02_08995, partial [Deinococcales bacterium]